MAGRPKKDKTRDRISISIWPEVKADAEASGNASKYFEEAALTCKAIREVLAGLGKGASAKSDVEAAFEDIDDLLAVWERAGEKSIPFADVLEKMRGPKPKRAAKKKAG